MSLLDGKSVCKAKVQSLLRKIGLLKYLIFAW